MTSLSGEIPVLFHLLGRVDYEACESLQRRLMYDVGAHADGRMVVLLCEHPPLITVGRRGSRGHIRLTGEQLRHRGLAVKWVGRGGGCVLHGPGQLCVYPLVSLQWHAWTVADYVRRLQCGLRAALRDMRVTTQDCPGRYGLWGRTGQLVHLGVSVREGFACHGAFVNVHPEMTNQTFVDVAGPGELPDGYKPTMGCMLAEGRQAVSMSKARACVVQHLAEAFASQRYHLHTGHPSLDSGSIDRRERTARAG